MRTVHLLAPSTEPPVPDLLAQDASHVVQFYETDAFLVEALVRYVGGALGGGDVAIVIATEPHRAALEERLDALGIDVALARRQDRLVVLDALATLSTFMVDDWP